MYDQKVDRPYLLGTLAWLLPFVLLLMAAPALVAWLPESLAWLAAVLPALPALYGLRVDLGWLRRSDEMQRQIYLESLFYGSYLFGIFVVVCYSLYRLEVLPAPSLDSVFLLYVAFNLGGWLLARRRYT